MVRSAKRKIFALEHVDPATGETHRVRRARELEVNVRKLFGVLPLPGRASAVAESFALRFGGERSARRSVSRRLHEDQSRKKSDHDRKGMRGIRRQNRRSPTGFLLHHLSEHAA